MDVVGSEIGQKMRSAIKAKLTELGCYVDDELPDYVMVMVANKRTRAQMEDDLQLFLGDNTELFVNWLHQVLKKLQEVTVTPSMTVDGEKSREKTKEKKSKEKKDKEKVKKTDSLRKAKKRLKEKSHRKKEDKKAHKSKRKSKHHEMIHPNVPPLLMNIEKESEPSITDVFAGQILKNHGITLDTPNEDKQVDIKPVINEIKRPILPIIDPATIHAEPEPSIEVEASNQEIEDSVDRASVSSVGAPREEQIKEINEIEAKIQGLKQKLAEQLDSMSDDEDFLNIRTEAEELMNDFAEDVFQEISQQAPPPPVTTTPLIPQKSPTPPPPKPQETPKENPEVPKEVPEILPQIELKLPKRPVRERLGAKTTKEDTRKLLEVKEKDSSKRIESPERFTPEREPDFWGASKLSRGRGDHELPKRISMADSAAKTDSSSKKMTSKVSALEKRAPRSSCASVVRVRPRPRVGAPASSLLMRAVADAHKSLLNIPPKVEPEPQKIKRALVLPMRRTVETQQIVIQVPRESDRPAGRRAGPLVDTSDFDSDADVKNTKVVSDRGQEEFVNITKKIKNIDYVPPRRSERTSSKRDDTLVIETINIHNTTVDKDKNTQFIVTMDGFNTNAFLAKKLMTEGLLNDGDEINNKLPSKSVLKTAEKLNKSPERPQKSAEKSSKSPEKSKRSAEKTNKSTEKSKKIVEKTNKSPEKPVQKENIVIKDIIDKDKEITEEPVVEKTTNEFEENYKSISNTVPKKRLSGSSEDSDTQVIIKQDIETEKRSVEENSSNSVEDSPPVKKRKASPIVFDVLKKIVREEKVVEKVKERERTESVGSDGQVVVTTSASAHKYDSVPPLSQAEKKLVWCRSFPLCRYGAACAFQHPRCKFAAACTRRGCVYSHGPARLAPITPPPVLASHVVPAANFKSITSAVLPSVCKFYPNCVNPTCHYYHPKPCRYGKACANKLECNFYHIDVPSGKWQHPV